LKFGARNTARSIIGNEGLMEDFYELNDSSIMSAASNANLKKLPATSSVSKREIIDL